MIKSRPGLIPWDCCLPVDVDAGDLLSAARYWWCRETEALPCTIPSDYVLGVGRVLAHGAEKYPAMAGRSWESVDEYRLASVHFDAMMRHAYSRGNEPESELPHEDHAMTRYMMLSALLARGTLIDDRPPAVLKADEVRVPKGSYVTSGGES